VRARARYQDYDGIVRTISRYGPSQPRAEANLKDALRDRVSPTSGQLDQDSKFNALAQLSLEAVNARDLAVATKELCAAMVERHVSRGARGAAHEGDHRPGHRPVHQAHGAAIRTGHGQDRAVGLSGMLGLAVRHGVLPTNPIRDVTRIARPHKPVRALTAEESATLCARFADAAAVLLGSVWRTGPGGAAPLKSRRSFGQAST
jgi:hypothetical protein